MKEQMIKHFFIFLFSFTFLYSNETVSERFVEFEEYINSKKTQIYSDKRDENFNDKPVNITLVYMADIEEDSSKAQVGVETNLKNVDVTGFIRYRYENVKRRNVPDYLLLKRK